MSVEDKKLLRKLLKENEILNQKLADYENNSERKDLRKYALTVEHTGIWFSTYVVQAETEEQARSLVDEYKGTRVYSYAFLPQSNKVHLAEIIKFSPTDYIT